MSIRSRKRIIVLLAVIVVGGLIGWQIAWRPGPSFAGKSYRDWMRSGSREEAVVAFRSMGAAAVPYLIKDLAWQPSKFLKDVQRRFPDLPFTRGYMQGATDPRSEAAYFLGEIGVPARGAITNLEALCLISDLPSSWHVNMAARAALIKLKGESLTPYIDELQDTSDAVKWYPKALLLGQFGTNGVAAVPALLAALNPTNNDLIHGHALIALGQIKSRADVCVPAITSFLTSPSISSRQKAIGALASFGEDARPAVKEITASLSDSDPWTRHMAGIALKRVDPAAAQKAGIK